MITFYILAVAIITAYLLLTIWRFERIPKSISDTYYQWSEINVKFLFTAVMWLTGILILIYWVSMSELYECQFLAFTSVSGMMFVGGACAFKETLTKGTHYTSAGIWAGSAIIFFLVNGMYPCVIVGGTLGLVGLILNRFKNLTFWAEIAVVLSMMVGIYLL